ncbi:MAG TPA: cytochrome c biogenesis protein CcdA [Micrococcaceae bacterium]|nr:cytochrome c biogenesis protein CcdA [Micrococcaceae bacterium]
MDQLAAGSSLILYSFTLGLVAAVNPCGFPMLPAYLALFAGSRSGPKAARIAGALRSGASMSAGFVAAFGSLGLLLQGGAALVAGALPWLMMLVGVGMAVAGVFTIAGRGPRLRLPAPRIGRGRSVAAMALYGVAYAAGSLSCSLPLFLAAVGGAFAGHGMADGLASYLAYALGMGLFVTAAAVVAATAGTAVLRHVRSAARWLPMVSGIVLTAAGSYLAYYWAGELAGRGAASPLSAAVNRIQAGASTVLNAQPVLAALILGAIVLTSIAVVVHRTLTPEQDRPADPTNPAEPPSGKDRSSP